MESTCSDAETPIGQLRRLYRFMASRDFVAGRRELAGAGFSATRIENWIKSGRLIKVLRAVYSYGRDVETTSAAYRAAIQAAGPGSVLTGRSACEAWGIVQSKRKIPVEIEVGVRQGERRCLKGKSPAMGQTTVKVVKREFKAGDVRKKDGLDVVRPALALIDFSANASDREIRFAFLEACRLGLFGEQDLKYCYRKLVGRRGARRLRPYLTMWVPELGRIKSVLEGWFLLEWVERGHPMPRVNENVLGYEVDGHWPDQGVVLELDGDAFHRDPVQKRIDLQKQEDLEAHGLVVIRVTFKEFEADPAAAVAMVAGILGRI